MRFRLLYRSHWKIVLLCILERTFWYSFIFTNFNPNLEIMIHINWTFSLQLGAEGDTNMYMHGSYLPVSPLHTGLKWFSYHMEKTANASMPILTKVYCTWWFVFQDPNNNWAFALWKATLIIYIHVYPFSGGCNGTTSDQGRHKLLQAPVNMGEMAENLGKSSNTIYYNNMVSTII